MAFPFRLCLTLLGLLFFLSTATSRVLDVQPRAECNPISSKSLPVPETDMSTSPPAPLDAIDTNNSESPILRPISTGAVFKATAGQPIFIRLTNFLDIPENGAKVTTSPTASWVLLDHKEKAITGQVPIDCPAGRITINITVQISIAGRVIEVGFSFFLDILQPNSISTANSTPTTTARPINPGSSSSAITPTITTSSPATTTSAIIGPTVFAGQFFVTDVGPFLRNATDRVTALSSNPTSPYIGFRYFTPETQVIEGLVPSDIPDSTVAIDLTVVNGNLESYNVTVILTIRAAPDAPGSSTTTTTTTSRTLPTAFPTATVTQGQDFGIGFDRYRYAPGDIVGSESTDPPVDWIRLDQPPPFRANGLVGTVPATQPLGPIAVTLSIYGRGPDFQGEYTVTFTIIVVAAATNAPP